MSYRPHPLRQTQTADYAVLRQPSNASSSASSGYSHSSAGVDFGRHSTMSSSPTSLYSNAGKSWHKRGQSEASSRPPPPMPADNLYNTARHSLRPLSQVPAAGPLAAPLPSKDVEPTSNRHERGQSLDSSKLSLHDRDTCALAPTALSRCTAVRPRSMLLTRSDSLVRRGSDAPIRSLVAPSQHAGHHSAPLARPDIEKLGKSSTNQLRTLSRLAESGSSVDFAINSPAQEVVGLRGRRRLQRGDQPGGANKRTAGYGWEGRNWMDKQRQFLQAYEYLCHIGEAKEWIEDVIQRSLPPIVELEEALRDGVTLAEVVEALNPDRRFRIFRHARLQFRHSDNIAIFFRYLDEVELPDLFRFELIDLYEKKNIPKVIYCIHALSWLLFRQGIVDFRIGNLVGQLEFEHHELEAMQKGLDKLGVSMPSFGTMGADFGVEERIPTPEPVETEEERIERELAENEASVVDLQAQARAALVRMRLGHGMHALWDWEPVLVEVQSRIRGDWARQIVAYRLDMRRFSVGLQSAARGFLARRRQAQTEASWKQVEGDLLALQSLVRAAKARRAIRHQRARLQKAAAGPVRDVQAAVRGFLARASLVSQQRETRRAAGPVVARLQAATRGLLLRRTAAADRALLEAQEPSVTGLQAAARAMLARKEVAAQLEGLDRFAPPWEVLQAAVRGRTARDHVRTLKAELGRDRSSWDRLRASIRAAAARREVAALRDGLAQAEPKVAELQGMLRGMLARRRTSEDLDALTDQTASITELQAQTRGFLHRTGSEALLDELASYEAEMTSLQAFVRAMLGRGQVAAVLERLDEHDEAVTELQAATRAFVVRAQFAEKKRFFHENMQKVVKIQSFVRAKLQGEAYKSLTTGKNPPVGAVKNFVHLLNDSDFDFNEEVEFERMRKTVVQQVRQNEMLEQYIDQLDIKIALLVKNKITLDEVVRHQSSLGGHASSLLANSSLASSNQFDLKALNKSSRKKLESYQQLFFTLQTQPQYLARLFRRIREQGTPDKECKRIEHLVMGLFGYAQKRREEYYLLKLIARSLREEVEACDGLADYLRGNFFWTRILAHYTRSPRDRKYLRDLLGPLVRDNIVEDPALDLESDPVQIYRSAINNEELRTGRPSQRPLDVPREMAIKDAETRELFIDHLRDLREVCDQFLLALEDVLPRMPYGLRFVCRQTYEALQQHLPREAPQHLAQLVTGWLWRVYLQPAVTAPENVGVVEKPLSPRQKRNLGEVAKVLGQIATGRPFGGDNIYLQPLNAFVAESVERLAHMTQDLMAVPDAEQTFDIDEYNDLYVKNKPTLYIKMSDVFAIHKLVASELPSLCPAHHRDDVLREIMQDLGSAKNNETEMTAAGSSDIHMSLTPKLHDVEDPEAEVKALFMETKRCVLYIIRVQAGANLLDILVKPIGPEDELKWHAVLRDDFAAEQAAAGAYSDANMADVTRMSYYELKRTALENVMRLERLGRISKHNFYQDILNAIALDIRTKSRRRVQRQRELEGVRLTLANLHEKARYLEQQRKSYDDYIEQAMATLQNKKGKKRFLLPFTKQYNHQRELERSGRVPKFGSYKYSARALSDKGVLVAWDGAGAADARDWGQLNLTISCDEVGVFALEGSRGHIQMPGASALVSIEDLLQAQFESHQFMNLFEGNLRLNVNLLLHLLYKKFYRTQ